MKMETNGMLGAIIGEVAGSFYEFESNKTKDVELFEEGSRLTDDSIMTVAVGGALTNRGISLFGSAFGFL